MAILCFGPIAVSLIPFGILLLPIWVVALVDRVFGMPVGANYGPDETVWTFVFPIACLLLGIAGLVGLFRVISDLRDPDAPVRGRRLTQVLVACGLLSILIFNGVEGGINPFEATTAAIVYWILPLAGAIYFLYVARRLLFRS